MKIATPILKREISERVSGYVHARQIRRVRALLLFGSHLSPDNPLCWPATQNMADSQFNKASTTAKGRKYSFFAHLDRFLPISTRSCTDPPHASPTDKS
jgi:hypothetical protein